MNTKQYLLPAVVVSLALTGCGGSSNNDNAECHDDSCFDVSDSGRLMVSDAENAAVSVVNLENGVVLETLALSNTASALHASPGYRYGLATHRDDSGLVEIIDGGKYQEDHGDHLHPYEKDPSKLNVTIAGANPTHYEVHAGRGAIFFDGADGIVSKVVEFDDASLAAGTANSFELASAHHGTAEPLGEHILVSNKGTAPAESALPNKVELFHFHEGDGFESDEVFEELCPDLHGSFSTEEGTVFGCSDGVLVVSEGDNHEFTARKIANPDDLIDGNRIGSFSGHGESHLVAAWASNRGQNTQLYAINLEDDSMELVDWNGDSEASYSTAHMAATGEFLLVLDTTGTLHILSGAAEHDHEEEEVQATAESEEEHEEHGFEPVATVEVIGTMPTLGAHSRVSITSSPSSDFAYVVDAQAKQVAVVHLEDGEVERRIDLSFTPAHAAWVGIAEEHSHEEDGHSHD